MSLGNIQRVVRFLWGMSRVCCKAVREVLREHGATSGFRASVRCSSLICLICFVTALKEDMIVHTPLFPHPLL